MRRFLGYIFFIGIVLCIASAEASAQFKEEAFTQSYNDDADTTGRDSLDVAFSFKEFFGGAAHKRDARIGVMFAGSTVFIGGQQIYNRQYWKLPFIYGGLASTAGLGIYYRRQYSSSGESRDMNLSNLMFAGTALVYWATLLDGVGNYQRGKYPQAGKATLYSALLPGLGQAYNGEYWKIPIYYGCLIGATHFLLTNNTNYLRFKKIHNQVTTPDSGYSGPYSAETALYYRDVYRRYRDYSIVALAGFYILQIVDANVFSYMQGFEIGDDITMKVSPTVISPEFDYAFSMPANQASYTGFGMKIGFSF